MGRFINPFTDWGFKMLFGQEANKDILIFFLNELLKGERKIEDIEFLDKEQLGDSSDDRSLIYDVYCKTGDQEYIIVEMQNKSQANFVDRSLYYVSKSLVSQAHKGDWRYKVTAVYGVFFMNFKMANALDAKLRTDVILADRDTGRQVSDKLRMIYLQLPYFNKSENECENDFERIIYVLKKMEALERMPFEKKNFIFTKLAKIAEVRKLTDRERIAYDTSLKKYWDTYNVFTTAVEEGLAKGHAEGRAEGLAEGRAKGLAEGRAEGRTEGLSEGEAKGRRKSLESIAVKMARGGMAYDAIEKFTGLSEDEIKTIMAEVES